MSGKQSKGIPRDPEARAEWFEESLRLEKIATEQLDNRCSALISQRALDLDTIEDLKAKFNVADEFATYLKTLLVAWVTSKRAENRHMTVEEKALFDEGMKLVPPREYVALEEPQARVTYRHTVTTCGRCGKTLDEKDVELGHDCVVA